MLSSGENIHWLARQMGHRDATMILRTYGKWIPDVDPSAGSKAEELAKTLYRVLGRNGLEAGVKPRLH